MRSYLRGLLRRLASPLVRLFGRSKSPWKRLSLPVPIGAFGPGSLSEFAQYFEGESHVRVESIDEIVEWLLNCQYMTDAIQFNERDLWQHPISFEQLRCGDCEDFALWAWRKLADLGIDAEFYVGRVVRAMSRASIASTHGSCIAWTAWPSSLSPRRADSG